MNETAREMTRIGAVQPRASVASLPAVVAGKLDRVVSMQWNGSLDGAVKRLAADEHADLVPLHRAFDRLDLSLQDG